MNFRNLAELLRRQAERFGPRPAVRFKRDGLYHDLSWDEYFAQTLACAAGLVEQGIGPGDRVGILSENRVEWLLADMGILAAGAVNVPPHAPLTAQQVCYQLADAEVRWLFVSTQNQLDKIRGIRGQLPLLKGVVGFDNSTAAAGAVGGQAPFSASASYFQVQKVPDPFPPPAADAMSWTEFLALGRQALGRVRGELQKREQALTADDLATLMYTSGTTGNPKGVMLTHGNLLSNALATNEASPRLPQAVLLNWLPFSHIYARTVDHYLSLVAGVLLCLGESPETVVENLEEVWPTHMASVPRFYEKVLTVVKIDDVEETGRRLRKIFGPRLDWLSSGGAPLPLPVAQEFHKAGLLILQGYGLTESSPVISFNRKTRFKLDTVGQAIGGVEIACAPDGEVLTRGPHVMKGYWKDRKATAEAIRDGWLHTGDLGRIDGEGFLTITGRKKEILVLSNGKKAAPSYLEGLLLADPCIDQAVIFGEGRNFLTALIVPHWDNVRQALGSNLPAGNNECLAKDQSVIDCLSRRIESALEHVSSWEKVKKFIVLPRPFSVEAEELTVSLKMRRNVVFGKYKEELDHLYES
jgi:long-chain acyl-CoA synthetase